MSAELRAIEFACQCLALHRDIANFFIGKARRQAAEQGHYRAALNLRKQGVPLEVARMMFFGRA